MGLFSVGSLVLSVCGRRNCLDTIINCPTTIIIINEKWSCWNNNKREWANVKKLVESHLSSESINHVWKTPSRQYCYLWAADGRVLKIKKPKGRTLAKPPGNNLRILTSFSFLSGNERMKDVNEYRRKWRKDAGSSKLGECILTVLLNYGGQLRNPIRKQDFLMW